MKKSEKQNDILNIIMFVFVLVLSGIAMNSILSGLTFVSRIALSSIVAGALAGMLALFDSIKHKAFYSIVSFVVILSVLIVVKGSKGKAKQEDTIVGTWVAKNGDYDIILIINSDSTSRMDIRSSTNIKYNKQYTYNIFVNKNVLELVSKSKEDTVFWLIDSFRNDYLRITEVETFENYELVKQGR